MDTFDSYLTDSLVIMYLQSATCGNSDLFSAWTQCEALKERITPGGPSPTYDEYYAYLLQYVKKLEVPVENNTPSLKANSSKTDYLTPYSLSDPFFSYATDLPAYMTNQDVDSIQNFLQCNQVLKEGRPRLPQRTRREPVQNELRIQNPTWSGLQGDLRKA